MATVSYDVQKAFDALNHETLSAEMENGGIRGIGLDLVKSYLFGLKIPIDVSKNCLI